MSLIEMPCLYWPDQTVTVLSHGTVSRSFAKKLAKKAFKKLRKPEDKYQDCRILVWHRLFNTKQEAKDWK